MHEGIQNDLKSTEVTTSSNREILASAAEENVEMPRPVIHGRILNIPALQHNSLTTVEPIHVENPEKDLIATQSVYASLINLLNGGEKRPTLGAAVSHLMQYSGPAFILGGMGLVMTSGIAFSEGVKLGPQHFQFPIWGIAVIAVGTSAAFWLGSKLSGHQGFQVFKERNTPGRSEAEAIYDGLMGIHDETNREVRTRETVTRFENRIATLKSLIDKKGTSSAKSDKIIGTLLGSESETGLKTISYGPLIELAELLESHAEAILEGERFYLNDPQNNDHLAINRVLSGVYSNQTKAKRIEALTELAEEVQSRLEFHASV